MPFQLAAALPSIISGATSLIGQGINAISQNRANKQQLAYNQQMYQQQRKDSLADWEMQNRYGSPEQQMQRLKEAGLNPHLVYGKGTVDNFAGAVRSSDAKPYSPIAPKLDLSAVGQSISQYADLQLKSAQTDNLRNAIEVSQEQKALIAANALKVLKETDYTTFKMFRDDLLLSGQVDAQKALIRKTNTDTDNAIAGNTRAQEIHNLMKEPNLQKVLAEIENLKLKSATSSFERELIKANIDNIRSNTATTDMNRAQQKVLNSIIQENMLTDIGIKRDQNYINKKRLELEQAGFDRGWIDQILRIIQTFK